MMIDHWLTNVQCQIAYASSGLEHIYIKTVETSVGRGRAGWSYIFICSSNSNYSKT